MAKVTRIKAKDSPESSENSDKRDEEAVITRKEIKIQDKKEEKTKKKPLKKKKGEDDSKKPFILVRPFVYLGRYLRDSWRELRQVRWPNRKATWKMVLAVLVYTIIFVIIISLLDLFFTWLFGHIIK